LKNLVNIYNDDDESTEYNRVSGNGNMTDKTEINVRFGNRNNTNEK
jgi:hypothetical protein